MKKLALLALSLAAIIVLPGCHTTETTTTTETHTVRQVPATAGTTTTVERY
jgi:hypothetical protein